MSFKAQSVQLINFGPIQELDCQSLAKINLVIGENGAGKTTFLKALYTAMHAVDEKEHIQEKLLQMFKVQRFTDLQNDSQTPLSFKVLSAANECCCLEYDILSTDGFVLKQEVVPKSSNMGKSVFIPAHEIVSFYDLFRQYRGTQSPLDTGDVYNDLLNAIEKPESKKLSSVFALAKDKLDALFDETVLFVPSSNSWSCTAKDGSVMPLSLASSSAKKIALIIHLIKNGVINKNSVLFFDGLEDEMHPDTLCALLDILFAVTRKTNIQIFISSSSYFVIKKLALLAFIPEIVNCIYLKKGQAAQIFDLNDGVPDNSIIQKSVDLYREEIEQILN